MKEFNINGAVMKCYPLTAAQRMHFYTIKFSPPQVLCIGTGVYVRQELDFGKLKEAIYKAYQMFETMRLRFVEDEVGTLYQYISPFEERDIPLNDFSSWKEEDVYKELSRRTSIPFQRCNPPLNVVEMVKMPGGYNTFTPR